LIAELPLCDITRFPWLHPGFSVLSRLHLEMEPHLLFQFAVELISPQVEEQPAPEL
jgi:hypothetical protein